MSQATYATYHDAGWWGDRSIGDHVAAHAVDRPERAAFVSEHDRLTWSAYDSQATRLAAALADLGFERGEHIAVLLPDSPSVHLAYLALERAGLVVVGIGPRAGAAEVGHLVRRSQAKALICQPHHRDEPIREVLRAAGVEDVLTRLVELDGPAAALDAVVIDGITVDLPPLDTARARVADLDLGPDELFLLNATSGTTGLPKCVMHRQNEILHFATRAIEAGALTDDDVFLSAIPTPFGFGMWSSHVASAKLGVTTVVLERFSPDAALELIERERVTVMMCVSTQFIMMLGTVAIESRDLSSLRGIFTGGEAVPYEKAAAFEERTGARVLQFYGSNETGALSRTTVDDTRERRLRTAGRLIDEMDVRLYDEAGMEQRTIPGVGRPAGRGPLMCLGYFDDDKANAELFTSDGWMLMGDLVEIDADGYLTVVGRVSDIIIRGGKNISAVAVEEGVLTHPAVTLAAAVAMPDPVFGERVCVYACVRDGETLDLDGLVAHLRERGTSPESLPERLIVIDELPRSSGGKVAKAELREDIRRRLAGSEG